MKAVVLRTFLLALIVFSFPVNTASVLAACDQGDAPDCGCFNDTGDWDAGGSSTSDPIQDVALDTLGTEEACNSGIPGDDLEKDSGKPYYSIVLGYNSEASALAAAEMMAAGVGSFESRQAWCSEAISYWHRETGVPYILGYRNPDWHPNWLIKSVTDLRTWYETEEDGGRGRWVEATELDYNDFQPGVNAPVPGAYMAWTGCVTNVTTGSVDYYAFEVSHSLMIDEMTIHRDGMGKVFKVEVTFIEGNSGNRVKNTRHWDDIITFTPQGSQWIGWNKGPDKIEGTLDDIGIKIYGFGIDLNASGQPVYDANRLHYKDHLYLRPVIFDSLSVRDNLWETKYASRIPALKTLASNLRKNGGPDISCSSDKIQCTGLPDGSGTAWSFPKEIDEDVIIQVDFLAPNPMPLKGVRMFWSPEYMPQSFQVQLVDADNQVYNTTIDDFSQYIPPKDIGPIPMMAKLNQPVTGIRYITFTFPKAVFATSGALLQDMLIPYDAGTYDDADEVPEDVPVFVDIKPGTCPNLVRPGDTGKILIALLGSNMMDVTNIYTQNLLFNNKTLNLLSFEYKDVSTPFIGSSPGCHKMGADGFTDLVLSYDVEEFIEKLGLKDLGRGKHLEVKVTGQRKGTNSDESILGQDFVFTPASLPYLLLLDEKK